MEKLKHNIVNIYGKRGEEWLAGLPCTIELLQQSWELSELKPFPNLSYSYLLKGLQGKTPIVLKLSPDANLIDKEDRALKAFKGFGAIAVLRREEGALLLEQAVPGDLLKNKLPQESRIEIVCKVMERLHQAPISSKEGFPAIEEWLAVIDKEWDLPKNHLERARKLKKKLVKKGSGRKVLLHGDLHQENILSQGTSWVVIDPKGVIGDPIDEIATCVADPIHDLKFLAAYFGYSFQEVTERYYLRLILASCWQAEDNLDPSPFLTKAQSVLPMIEPLKQE